MRNVADKSRCVKQMMNEPHRGYVEIYSMHAFDYNTDLHLGHVREILPTVKHLQLLKPCFG